MNTFISIILISIQKYINRSNIVTGGSQYKSTLINLYKLMSYIKTIEPLENLTIYIQENMCVIFESNKFIISWENNYEQFVLSVT